MQGRGGAEHVEQRGAGLRSGEEIALAECEARLAQEFKQASRMIHSPI